MKSDISTPKDYIDSLAADRQKAIKQLRQVIRKNLPTGFKETMAYGMIAYVVPLKLYPEGYHCQPDTPLPFINLASQKNHIAVYHMGIYADQKLMNWFTAQYSKQVDSKLDMGKSCIRFKRIDQIPVGLIGELASRLTPTDWIKLYESSRQ